MKENFVTLWKDGMAFESEISGHKVLMDAEDKFGGNDKGPRPKALLIAALTGCTGMDVVAILKKMQIEIDSFDIKTETELTDEHPKTYTKMHLVYEFTGSGLNENKIKQAVKLSQDKYCGVSALFGKALDLSYEINIIEK